MEPLPRIGRIWLHARALERGGTWRLAGGDSRGLSLPLRGVFALEHEHVWKGRKETCCNRCVGSRQHIVCSSVFALEHALCWRLCDVADSSTARYGRAAIHTALLLKTVLATLARHCRVAHAHNPPVWPLINVVQVCMYPGNSVNEWARRCGMLEGDGVGQARKGRTKRRGGGKRTSAVALTSALALISRPTTSEWPF